MISRVTSHLQETAHTTNEYKERVKSRLTSKNFHLNFYLWKWGVTCSSRVQVDMSRVIHKVIHEWNFIFGTEVNFRLMIVMQLENSF